MFDFLRRRTSALALLLYAGFIVYQSLAGGGAWQCGGAVLSMNVRLSRSDLLANVVAYVPLGLLWGLATTGPAIAGWRTLAGRVVVGLSLLATVSVTLELVQACQVARTSSAYDSAANALGGAAGLSVALLLRASADRLNRSAVRHWHATSDAWLRAVTAMVAAGWVVSQTMPWVFAVDVGTLRANLSFIRHWWDGPPFDVWRAAWHAGAWLAVACACRLVAGDQKVAAAGFVCIGGLSLFLQLLLDARAPLSFEELIGMGIGAVLVLPLMLHAGRQPAAGPVGHWPSSAAPC